MNNHWHLLTITGKFTLYYPIEQIDLQDYLMRYLSLILLYIYEIITIPKKMIVVNDISSVNLVGNKVELIYQIKTNNSWKLKTWKL